MYRYTAPYTGTSTIVSAGLLNVTRVWRLSIPSTKNCNNWMIFSENFANCVWTLSEEVNNYDSRFHSPPTATETANVYTMLGFVIFIAKVNLF